MRRWIIVAAVLAMAAAAFAYLRLRPMQVTVEPVTRGRAVEAIYATGTVEPIDRVIVKSRLAEHVARIAVEEGDRVEAGQLLAQIDSAVRDLALSQAKTQLAKARQQAGRTSPQLAALRSQVSALRAQLELARTDLMRTQNLFEKQAVARQELDAARARVDQLDAQTQAAEDQLRSARVELGATAEQLDSQVRSLATEADESAVRAPIGGLVMSRLVEPGEVVTVNQPLFEIADDRALRIELKVDEADIARVRDGADGSTVALTFFAFPDRAFAGKVETILPEPDRVRRSYTVKVRLDAPIPGLRIGMTAEANIVVQRKDDVLLVPAEAVQGNTAWFVEQGRAVQRPVTLGIADLTRAELVGGAPEGALAIVAAPKPLTPGQRVKPTLRRAP